jgi:hypothetical protein
MAIAFVANSSPASTGVTTATSLDLSLPSGVQSGDLLVAMIFGRGTQNAFTTPSGWTEKATIAGGGDGVSRRVVIYYKLAGSSEPSTTTFSWATARGAYGLMAAYRGVHQSTPVESGSSTVTATTGTSTPTLGSITMSATNGYLVSFMGCAQISITYTPPTGMTEQVDSNVGTPVSISLCYNDEAIASSGATGSRAHTGSASNARYTGAMIALIAATDQTSAATYEEIAAIGYEPSIAIAAPYSEIEASGYQVTIAIAAPYPEIATEGYQSAIAITAQYSEIATEGYEPLVFEGAIASYSEIATEGYAPSIALNAPYSELATQGYQSAIAIAATYSEIATEGYVVTVTESTAAEYGEISAIGYEPSIAVGAQYGEIATEGYAPGSEQSTSASYGEIATEGYEPAIAVAASYSEISAEGYAPSIAIVPDYGVVQTEGYAPAIAVIAPYSEIATEGYATTTSIKAIALYSELAAIGYPVSVAVAARYGEMAAIGYEPIPPIEDVAVIESVSISIRNRFSGAIGRSDRFSGSIS